MTEQQRRLVQELFDQVAALPPDQREAALHASGVDDPAVLREVRALLAAEAAETIAPVGQRLVEEAASALGATVGPPPVLEIGNYQVSDPERNQREGGMGIVYRAQQVWPVKREVALKVIKRGMDTDEVLARFRTEQQAMALMNHPNIARIFDAGATREGRPYFAMEWVDGEPIVAYCRRHRLNLRARLDLFGQVCDAIKHAHGKGIIHRDIKPSNVLVAVVDGKPGVKVIDFGVAKAINQPLAERAAFTQFGQIIGTPGYMSPEQAEMNELNVDVRTDVYSLGVLLYELLTGTQPFPPQELRSRAYDEIVRIIREVDPPRPSTRVSTLGEEATRLSGVADEPARSLVRTLRSELEWIPMMAMRKDRTHRYETVAHLAEDVRRYLNAEPLEAGPPRITYVLKKWLHRRRFEAAVAGVAGVLVLAAIGVTGGAVARAAEKARGEARERGLRELVAAEADRFVVAGVSAVDPKTAGRSVVGDPRVALLNAAERTARRLIEHHGDRAQYRADRARYLNTLGVVLFQSQQVQEAEAALNEALRLREALLNEVPNDPQRRFDFASTVANQGLVATGSGSANVATLRFDDARRMFEALLASSVDPVLRSEATSALAQVLHNQAVATLDAVVALPLLEQALGLRRKLHSEKPLEPRYQRELAQSLIALGKVLQGNDDENAVRLFREAMTLPEGPTNEQTAEASSWIAVTDLAAGRRDAGVQANRDAIRNWQNLCRPRLDQLHGVPSTHFLAFALLLDGDAAGAEVAASWGMRFGASAWLDVDRAHALVLQGRSDEAIAIYRRHLNTDFDGVRLRDFVADDIEMLRRAGVASDEFAPIQTLLNRTDP